MGRACFADRLETLEARENTERAVEDAALGDGVDVRAREDDRGFWTQGADAGRAEDVARDVHPRFEPGRPQFPEKPRASLLVRR